MRKAEKRMKDIAGIQSAVAVCQEQKPVHDKYMKIGEIPSYAYQNFCEMYEAYHELGGNGMITKMMHEIEELHLKKKGEKTC